MNQTAIKETASHAAVEAMKTALNVVDRNAVIHGMNMADRMTVLTLMGCDLIARLEVLIEADGNMAICRPMIDEMKITMEAKRKEIGASL